VQRKNIVLLLSFVFIILIIFGMNVVPYFSLSNTNNDVIKIGGLLPLTGSLAYQGADIKKGLDMAIDEINSNSGIKGCNLKIVYEDFGSDFKQAVEGYQKLTKIDEVKIIVPSYGDTVLAIAPLAEQDEVISFAVASGSPKISIAGDFTFRNNLLPQDEVKEMANYFIYSKHKSNCFVSN
jgi:branched-chain amino acid transport system substrate-binding protein